MKRIIPILVFAFIGFIVGCKPTTKDKNESNITINDSLRGKPIDRKCGAIAISEAQERALMNLYGEINRSADRDLPGSVPEQLNYGISVHLLSKSGRSPLSLKVLNDAITHLNEVYGKVYINFRITSIDSISTQLYLDDFYYQLSSPSVEDFFDRYNKLNVINLYVVDNTPNGSMLNGFTYPVNFEDFPKGRNRELICLAPRTIGNRKTLGHEMGHYFTLLHTFNVISIENSAGMITDELADRSNCESSGDLICDTPGDPFDNTLDVRSCTYIGEVKDKYGNRYKPMINNFMAYYEACCDYQFTPGQYKIIRKVADSYRPYLRRALPKPVSTTPATTTATTTTTPTTPKPATTTTTTKPATTTTTKPAATTTTKPATTTTTKPAATTTTPPKTSTTKPPAPPVKPTDSSTPKTRAAAPKPVIKPAPKKQ